MVKLEEQIAEKRISQSSLNIPSNRKIQARVIQKSKISSITSSYKSKGYEVTETGDSITFQTPAERIDPEYGGKYSRHIITFDKEGNLLSDYNYQRKRYKGSYSSYLVQSKQYQPKTNTIQERNYDISGYTTKLRSDKIFDRSSGQLLSQDRWGASKPKAEDKKFYFNEKTGTFSTAKIKGQKPVTKTTALRTKITKVKTSLGVSFQKGATTKVGPGVAKKLQKLGQEGYYVNVPIDTRRTSLQTPTYSARTKRKDYFIPLKKEFDYSAIAYKPYGEGTATVYPVVNQRQTTQQKINDLLKSFQEFNKKPAEERREFLISSMEKGIDKATRKLASIDPGINISLKAYDKSFGEGHGTPGEQVKALPYSVISGFAQLPTFVLKGYDIVATGSEKGYKEAGKKTLNIADEMMSAYEQAPITTVGTLLAMGYVGKKAGQIKLTEKPTGIKSKAQKGLKEISKDPPTVDIKQFSIAKELKFMELRNVEKIAKPNKMMERLINKETAIKYKTVIPEKTALIMESQKGSRSKLFSVEVGGTTYQTLLKDNFMVKTEISKKGKAKFKIFETEKALKNADLLTRDILEPTKNLMEKPKGSKSNYDILKDFDNEIVRPITKPKTTKPTKKIKVSTKKYIKYLKQNKKLESIKFLPDKKFENKLVELNKNVFKDMDLELYKDIFVKDVEGLTRGDIEGKPSKVLVRKKTFNKLQQRETTIHELIHASDMNLKESFVRSQGYKKRLKLKPFEIEKEIIQNRNTQFKHLLKDSSKDKPYYKKIGEFEKQIDPYVKLTEPTELTLKEGFGDYPKEWDYKNFYQEIGLQELLYGKKPKQIIPKEIFKQEELDIGYSKFVQTGKDVPAGYFVTRLASKMEAKTLEPAFTSKMGKPVITEGMQTVPEFIFKEINPTEYKFSKILYPKEKSVITYTPEGEIMIGKEAVSSSKQIYSLEAYGELSFNKAPVKKLRTPEFTPAKETTPFKWLKEKKAEKNIGDWEKYADELARTEGLKPITTKSELSSELARSISRSRKHGDKIIEMLQKAEAKKTQNIMIQQPEIQLPSNIYNIYDNIGIPKGEIKGLGSTGLTKTFKAETKQLPKTDYKQSILDSELKTKINTILKKENINFNIQLQNQKQSQLQTQIQRQTQIQKQTQVQKQVQKQTQVQTQVQKQVQLQKQIQTQLQLQKQIQTQLQTQIQIMPTQKTPISILPSQFLYAPLIPKLKKKIKSKRAGSKKKKDLLLYSEDFTSRAIGLEPTELTSKQFENLLGRKLIGLELRTKIKLKKVIQ